METKHTPEPFVGKMQPPDVIIRQVEVECLLDVFIWDFDSFVPLTETGEISRPVDRQAHRTQRERIVVHVRMKLVRSSYTFTYNTM